jgi:hypothetical protein
MVNTTKSPSILAAMRRLMVAMGKNLASFGPRCNVLLTERESRWVTCRCFQHLSDAAMLTPMHGSRGGARAVVVALALVGAPRTVLASDPSFGPHDVETLFSIAKSDDRNRVDYGMRLGADCAPTGQDPVFPYWREFERSPPVRTKPMGVFARMGYGISSQRTLRRTPTGAEHAIRLKQVDRLLFITTTKGADGRCSALVRIKIADVEYAELRSIYVKLSGSLSVAYIDIRGQNLATGQLLEERLRR